MSVRRRLQVTVLAAAALVSGGCIADGPTGLGPGERLGQIALPGDRAALVVEVSPAAAVDSVRIGAPGTTYRMSAFHNGRVIVYATGDVPLPRILRFRIFAQTGGGTARVVESATATGEVDTGRGIEVFYDR